MQILITNSEMTLSRMASFNGEVTQSFVCYAFAAVLWSFRWHYCNFCLNNCFSAQIFAELALWAGLVIEAPCPSVCPCVCGVAKHPLSGVVETSGQRMYPQYWPVIKQFSKKNACHFFMKLIWINPQPHQSTESVSPICRILKKIT